jgi:hypothetical protein
LPLCVTVAVISASAVTSINFFIWFPPLLECRSKALLRLSATARMLFGD